MNWKPIDTAPKDGTKILVVNARWKSYDIARWSGDLWKPQVEEHCHGGPEPIMPTHWMELPEAPKV